MTTNPEQSLYRLMSWLSPSFPVGAYSYSHGIEYAFEAGDVTDAPLLQTWIEGILVFGSARQDAILFRAGWEAAARSDDALMDWVIETAAAMRGTKEMALESTAQGAAFVDALGNTWPHDGLVEFTAWLDDLQRSASYPVAVGVATAHGGIALEQALAAYLHAFISNLVSAGVRLIPLGQTAGQQIIAALEAGVIDVAEDIAKEDLHTLQRNIGSTALVVDWTSMQHETQYTRLFRT